MLGKLTEEQEKIMYETRDEWINLFFDNVREQRGINKPLFEEGIKWLYEDMLGKKNPKIIYCDGWLSCLMIIAILKNKNIGASVWVSVKDSVRASVKDSVRNSVWNSVWDSVGASVGDSVWVSVWDSVGNSVWDSVGASVRDSVGASVWDSVGDSVRNSVWDSVGASVWDYSFYLDLSNYSWVSFFDFFEKIKIIDDFNFKQYKKIIRSGVFEAYEYENCVFAIQPPVYVERNGSGRLHSTTTAAVKFRDGSCYYFINGRSVPAWIVEEKEKITRDAFTGETNADVRGAMYEVLGQQGVMGLLGAETVDIQEIRHANGDVETVELLSTADIFPEIDNRPFKWVKVICPSTGTNYLLGVEPHHTDAREAVASLSPFNAKDYSFNYRT
jgi:hypothetical protein